MNFEKENNGLAEQSIELLEAARTDIPNERTKVIPLAGLSTLGAGLSSLIPELRKVTETISLDADGLGLYRIANVAEGDILKKAKDGTYWGAMKRADGSSKMGKLASVEQISETAVTEIPIDPSTIMLAVALASIERKLGDIEKIGKEISAFLEEDKHAEIKGDLETLLNITKRYDANKNNEKFINNNHKLAIDIQKSSLENITFYKGRIDKIINKKQILVDQKKVKAVLNTLLENFKYYRLSLYNYSMAAMIEVILSGNFTESNILDRIKELEDYSNQYRDCYSKSSVYLEKISNGSIESAALKGIGTAGNMAGKVIENIPVIKYGPVDEALVAGGNKIVNDAKKITDRAVMKFADLKDPKTIVFCDGLNSIMRIYNRTSAIYLDNDNLYLVSDDNESESQN